MSQEHVDYKNSVQYKLGRETRKITAQSLQRGRAVFLFRPTTATDLSDFGKSGNLSSGFRVKPCFQGVIQNGRRYS